MLNRPFPTTLASRGLVSATRLKVPARLMSHKGARAREHRLIGRSFLDPDLGVCTVSSVGPPFLLRPGAGNRTADPFLTPGMHPTLVHARSCGKRSHSSSVSEVARWCRDSPASTAPPASQPGPPSPAPSPPVPPPPARTLRPVPPATVPDARTLRARRRAAMLPSPSMFAHAHCATSTGGNRRSSTGAPLTRKQRLSRALAAATLSTTSHTHPPAATVTTNLNPTDDLSVPVLNFDFPGSTALHSVRCTALVCATSACCNNR